MLRVEASRNTNRLLDALPTKDRKRILTDCRPVELTFAEVLNEPGERIRHVYFPTDSFVSLVMKVNPREHLEVGMVGDEGMLGISAILGLDTSPLHAVVQGAGVAMRINIEAFQRQLARSPALTQQLKRYLYVTVGQLAQIAACNRFHVVEARLARWLLMTQDRSHASEFQLTQEFLAYMLGVRRVGVTGAAMALQESNLIRYSRGKIRVLDRKGLEAAACNCYAADNASYSRIMQLPPAHPR